MPLVDYASSDEESENDCDNSAPESVSNVEKNPPKVLSKSEETLSNAVNDNDATLFSTLPKPRKNFSFLGDDNKLSKLLLSNNSNSATGKESIKISVPSVSDFDESEPAPKKIKPSAKGVGLFSILPPPKNASTKETTRTLVPHSVSKAVKSSNLKSVKVPPPPVTKVETELDDDDTPVGNSFFGLTELSDSDKVNNSVIEETQKNTVPVATPVSSEVSTPSTWTQEVDPNLAYPVQTNIENYTEETSQPFIGPEIPDNNPLELDEKALQILCGGKKKRQQMDMNIIDLSGEEIMPDSKEWLLKQFTEEKKVGGHGRKKGEGPSSQQRRKHQITYLAYQAKAQELELQNQWANNRMSRKQTQSKYGF